MCQFTERLSAMQMAKLLWRFSALCWNWAHVRRLFSTSLTTKQQGLFILIYWKKGGIWSYESSYFANLNQYLAFWIFFLGLLSCSSNWISTSNKIHHKILDSESLVKTFYIINHRQQYIWVEIFSLSTRLIAHFLCDIHWAGHQPQKSEKWDAENWTWPKGLTLRPCSVQPESSQNLAVLPPVTAPRLALLDLGSAESGLY